MIEAIEPTDLPLPTGPYSHAIRAGGLIFVSGILALDEYGRTVSPGDAAAQASYIFAVLSKISRRPRCPVARIMLCFAIRSRQRLA